ncbi:hypothetical protein QBC35DRAFT_459700 [Podospora australis]|uniref:Uncharacterized protein n=1 Tax=Podospora australis TaxID=1536484 RepID=A0AAN6X1A8_9PEZI|nr:hypothetical protein QBC35DRAFT_459700 [Podospora australis]
MSSPRAFPPVRRFLEFALRTSMKTQGRAPVFQMPAQTRRFATRVPSRASSASQTPQPALIFPPEEVYSSVPESDAWDSIAEGFPEDITGEALRQVALRYCEVAVHGSTSWKIALERDLNIDAYTLYYTAVALFGLGNEHSRKLAMHMLLTGSDLSYTPSTLALVHMLMHIAKKDFKNAVTHRIYRDVNSRYQLLLKTTRDPNVLSLRARDAIREGKPSEALRWFKTAIEAGEKDISTVPPPPAQGSGTRGPRWHYEANCRLERGTLLYLEGQLQEAANEFSICANELGEDKAWFGLYCSTPETWEQKESMTMLLRAAQTGDQHAISALIDRLVAESKSPNDFPYIWEWARCCRDSAKQRAENEPLDAIVDRIHTKDSLKEMAEKVDKAILQRRVKHLETDKKDNKLWLLVTIEGEEEPLRVPLAYPGLTLADKVRGLDP